MLPFEKTHLYKCPAKFSTALLTSGILFSLNLERKDGGYFVKSPSVDGCVRFIPTITV